LGHPGNNRRIVQQEFPELGDVLLQLTEDEEGPALCPFWSLGEVTVFTEEDNTRLDFSLSGVRRFEAFDDRLSDTVNPSEVYVST